MSSSKPTRDFLSVLAKVTIIMLDAILIVLAIILPVTLATYAMACYYCGITSSVYLIAGIAAEISLIIVICVVTSVIKYL